MAQEIIYTWDDERNKTESIFSKKEIEEFLNYKNLDDTQKKYILNFYNLICNSKVQKSFEKECEKRNAKFSILNSKPLEQIVPLEEIISFEKDKEICLPDDYKWFLTNIGTAFFPNKYHLFDISFNKDFQKHFSESLLEIDGQEEEYDICKNYYFITFGGCTSFDILCLEEGENFGKVFDWDNENQPEIVNWSSDSDYANSIIRCEEDLMKFSKEHVYTNFGKYADSFLDYFKQNLIEMYNKCYFYD